MKFEEKFEEVAYDQISEADLEEIFLETLSEDPERSLTIIHPDTREPVGVILSFERFEEMKDQLAILDQKLNDDGIRIPLADVLAQLDGSDPEGSRG